MGTSHRHKLGVAGQPNWGSVSSSITGGLTSTFQEIANNGLSSWLQQNGALSLEGMSCRDILDVIRKYIDNSVTGLDDTAANEALEHIMDLLENRMGDDPSSFEEVMNNIVGSDEIKDLLDEFFGVYIFSFLSQSFAEKLEQEKGTETMSATMSEIKEQIIDDIKTEKNGRSVTAVDWSSEEGRNFIKTEFNRILYILAGNED